MSGVLGTLPAVSDNLDALAPFRPSGRALDRVFSLATEEQLGPSLLRQWGRWSQTNPLTQLGADIGVLDLGPTLTPQEAQERYGIGDLTFDRPVLESVAAERYAIKSRELAVADALARSPGTTPVEALGVGLLAGFTDPLTVGLGFVPLGAPSRLRALLAPLAALERSGAMAARVAGRAGFGAIEGAAAAAVVEAPLAAILMEEDRDYTFADSLTNILFGAGLGAATGAVLRAPDGLPQRVPDPVIEPPPAAVRTAPEAAREGATIEALAAVADGRPVEVGAQIVEAATAPRPIETGEGLTIRPIKAASVYAPTGDVERAAYAIVDVEDLVTSNDDALAVNPRYPGALQPRDRTRAASEAQIRKFGSPFQPERWGETPQAESGAPVVGADGVVESGNGRAIFLRRMYRAGDPRAAEYRAWLQSKGYPIEGVARPVLVRVLDPGRPMEARVRFADAANKPSAAAISATEQAFADARALDAALLAQHKGGAAGAAGNREFARRALARMATEQELGALVDADGALSKAGEQRLEAALMARAYGDTDVVAARFEARDEEFRSIGLALQDAAPAMARLADRLDAGAVSAEFDLRPALNAALDVLSQARKSGESVARFLETYVRQTDMFGGGPTQATLDALALMVDDAGRVRGRDKIASGLEAFAETALRSADQPLFTELRLAADDALDAAARARSEPGRPARLRPGDGGGPAGGGGRDGAANRGEVDGVGPRGVEAATGRLAAALKAAGRPDDQAAAGARILANALANLGRHFGMPADRLLDEVGLKIVGPDGEAPSVLPPRTVLFQSPSAEPRLAVLAQTQNFAAALRMAGACAAAKLAVDDAVAMASAEITGGAALAATGGGVFFGAVAPEWREDTRQNARLDELDARMAELRAELERQRSEPSPLEPGPFRPSAPSRGLVTVGDPAIATRRMLEPESAPEDPA